MKDLAELKWTCPVCGSENSFPIRKEDVRLPFMKQTNADRFRAMTDEELAKWIARQVTEGGIVVSDECIEFWLDWLKSPVEVDNG